MTSERAKELIKLHRWKSLGVLMYRLRSVPGIFQTQRPKPAPPQVCSVDPETKEERSFVMSVWDNLPGRCSYMSALDVIARGFYTFRVDEFPVSFVDQYLMRANNDATIDCAPIGDDEPLDLKHLILSRFGEYDPNLYYAIKTDGASPTDVRVWDSIQYEELK